MSWWVYLEDNEGKTFEVERHEEGGTYAVGGTNTAELNVTYNYGKHFDFNKLNGKKAKDTIEELTAIVIKLGKERDKDYWSPTEGNVGYACNILLRWAKTHPEGIWRVS